MARRSAPERSKRAPWVLGSLTPVERGQVPDALVIDHPELEGDAERIASELLSSVSIEQVALEVESAFVGIPLDALASPGAPVRWSSRLSLGDRGGPSVSSTLKRERSRLGANSSWRSRLADRRSCRGQ